MNKSNYLTYLFSDKEARPIWCFILIGLTVLSCLSFALYRQKNDIHEFELIGLMNFWSLGILTIIFIGFYTTSYLNYKGQLSIKRNITENRFENVEVEVYQDSFTVKPIKQNYDAKINISPKVEIFEIYLASEYFLLLGCVREFGLFRMHLKPLLIERKGGNCLNNAVRLRVNSVENKEKDTVIVLSNSYKSINKLVIKNISISS